MTHQNQNVTTERFEGIKVHKCEHKWCLNSKKIVGSRWNNVCWTPSLGNPKDKYKLPLFQLSLPPKGCRSKITSYSLDNHRECFNIQLISEWLWHLNFPIIGRSNIFASRARDPSPCNITLRRDLFLCCYYNQVVKFGRKHINVLE